MEWVLNFPSNIHLDFTKQIDAFIAYLNVHYADFFAALKAILNSVIGGIYQGLELIPWWLLILVVVLVTKKLLGRYRTGILYGLLLFLIGAFGYWQMMNETLSIVITAVILSLFIGLPIGILI